MILVLLAFFSTTFAKNLQPITKIKIHPITVQQKIKEESSEDTIPKGILGLPLPLKSLQEKLFFEYQKIIEKTNRFSVVEDGTQDGSLDLKIDLQDEYTKISQIFKSSSGDFRDESILKPDPEFQEVTEAFDVLIGILRNHLKHKAIVSHWQLPNIVISPGKESGFHLNELITVGVLKITKTHPQSGEILNLDSLPILQAKIIDAQKDYCIAEVIQYQEQNLFNTFEVKSLEKIPHNASLVVLEPLQDNLPWPTDSHPVTVGVTVPLSKDPVLWPGAQLYSPKENLKESVEVPRDSLKGANTEIGLYDKKQDNLIPYKQPIPPKVQKPYNEKSKDYVWSLGISLDFGTLETDLGSRYSGLTSTLFNHASIITTIPLPYQDWRVRPDLNVYWYLGNDVTGYQTDVELYVYAPLNKSSIGNLSLGLKPYVSYGQVQTIRVLKDLSLVDVLLQGSFDGEFANLGQVQVLLGGSLGRLMTGVLSGDLEVSWRPEIMSQTPFTFVGKIHILSQYWNHYTMGVLWDFLETSSSLP